jgi:pyruvate/2-oxoglutarate dehydrogenase complex dihydrolipoamide acyltransferase (E2) component
MTSRHTRLIVTISFAALLAACGQTAADRAATADEPQKTQTQAQAQAPTQIPPPPADPLAVGSQDAKDDLYCSGIIFVSNPSPPSALNPVDEAVLRKAQVLGINLAESGINKLVVQKTVHATHGALVADAYTEAAATDLRAGKPRISLEDCYARSRALPPVE